MMRHQAPPPRHVCVVVCGVVLLLWLLVWTTFPQVSLPPDPPSTGPPNRRTAQNFALFFPLPLPFSLFISLTVCLLVEFWWFLKRRGARLGSRVVVCETPPVLGPGLHTHILSAPALQTTKIPREGPTREGEKNENCGGKGKKARNFGPPTLRGPTLRGPLLPLCGPKIQRAKMGGGRRKKSAHPSAPHQGHLSGPIASGSHFFWVWPHPSFGAPPFRASIFPGLVSPLGPTMTHTRSKNRLAKWIGPNWSNQDGQNGIGQSRSLPSPGVSPGWGGGEGLRA